MKESEIFNQLCCCIANEGSPMDNSFFKRCYEVCMKNKDKMTERTICEIVNREYEFVKMKELQFRRIINRLGF